VNGLPHVFYHFHSLSIIRPGIFIPAKHACYPLPKTSLRLCYLPYLDSLHRAYESVRAILTDFDFGFDGESNLSRDHTVIARREFGGYLQNLGKPQPVVQLDQVWDCRTSKQVQPSDRADQVAENFVGSAPMSVPSKNASPASPSSSAEVPSSQRLSQAPRNENTRSEWPDPVVRWLERAEESFEEEDYKAASALLARALRLLPDSPELLAAYGNLMLRLEKTNLATRYLLRATVKDPCYVAAHADLAAVFLHLREYKEAKESARRALTLDPKNAEAQAILRSVATISGFTSSTHDQTTHTFSVKPSGREAGFSAATQNRHLQGFRNYERGDWEAALVCFNEVQTGDPLKQGINFMRAQCLLNLGRLSEAEQAVLSELSTKPDHPDALRLLSQLRTKREERLVGVDAAL
jgi:Flp pilus assembly protein TadD